MSPDRPAFELPTTGPDALPWDTALAAVLGYARGRRPLRYRSPIEREGRWVQVPAFGYERFDRRPVPDGPLGDDDVLVAEGLATRGRRRAGRRGAARPAGPRRLVGGPPRAGRRAVAGRRDHGARRGPAVLGA